MKRNNEDCAVYYAVNNSLKYLLWVHASIKSLRRHNRSIKVYLWLAGPAEPKSLSFVSRLNVRLISRPSVPFEERYFLKWLALKDLSEPRLLFVDADTIFFQDAMKMFRLHCESDFYARRESGTEPGKGPFLCGNRYINVQLDQKGFSSLFELAHSTAVPLFNTGVMVLNNAIHRKIVDRMDEFRQVRIEFDENRLPYPCSNRHITEEMVAAIVLGRIRGFSYQLIKPIVSPWYWEFKGGDVRSPGLIVHTGSEFFARALQDFRRPLGKIKKSLRPREVRNFFEVAAQKKWKVPKGGLPSRAVAYVLTGADGEQQAVMDSIRSLRKFNRDVQIYLIAFKKTGELETFLSRSKRVAVILRGSEQAVTPYSKWKWLAELREESILNLDTFSHLCGDVDVIFSRFSRIDLAAPQRLGTVKGEKATYIGNDVVFPLVDHEVYEAACRHFGTDVMPVFSSKSVILNNGFSKKIEANSGMFKEIGDAFDSKEVRYPSRTLTLKEDIITTLVLGKFARGSYQVLDRELVPTFYEIKGGAIRNPWVLTRVGEKYYPFFRKMILGVK